jgi:hypothetical protein
VQLNPSYQLARFHLAESYKSDGQFDYATDLYKQFVEIRRDADADIPEAPAAEQFIGKIIIRCRFITTSLINNLNLIWC